MAAALVVFSLKNAAGWFHTHDNASLFCLMCGFFSGMKKKKNTQEFFLIPQRPSELHRDSTGPFLLKTTEGGGDG